jgi:hypothetical protein
VAEPGAVRLYRPGDEVGIQALFATCFHPRSDEEWRWRYERAPLGPGTIVIGEEDGRIVAHLGLIRFAGSSDGAPRTIGMAGDLMVDPTARLKRYSDEVRYAMADAVDQATLLRTGYPSDAAADFLARHGRVKYMGRLHRRERRRAKRWSRPGDLVVEVGEDVPVDVDELAAASRTWAPVIVTRTREFLHWRWVAQPGTHWEIVTARRDGRLTGIAVVGPDRHPDRAGHAFVADLLAEDVPSTTAVLDAAAHRAEAAGATIVKLDLVDPRPWVGPACRAAGFRDRGDGPHMVVNLPCCVPSALDLNNWYLTRADTDLS